MVQAVAVADVRRLQLVAAVVAGRWLEIMVADAATHTTPDAIVVASEVDSALLRNSVLAQAALVGAGSLHAAWAAGLRDSGPRARTARRYLTLEVPRALRQRAQFLPGLRDLADTLGGDWPSADSPEESLSRARGRRSLPDPPLWFGRLAPLLPPIAAPGGGRRHVSDESGEPAAGEATELSPAFDDLMGLVQKFTLETDWSRWSRFARNAKRGSGRAASPGAGPTGRSRVHARNDTPRILVWRTGEQGDDVPALYPSARTSPRGSSRKYPEFDLGRMTLRENRCTVYDSVAPMAPSGPAATPIADAVLRRRLAPVVLRPAPSRRRSDGDEIDIDAAIDARARFVATGEHDDRVWLAPRVRRPDLSVLILLDTSGSVAAAAAGVSTHHRQVELTEAIADALGALGARVAVHGFRSHGRNNVEMIRIADFGTPWDTLARNRLHGCEPNGFTRVGAAIRRATDLIDERAGTSRRLLIVVSDGLAYDSGYEGSYAEADTRQALAAARARAVGTLCVTVGADTDVTVLRRLFGTAASVCVRTEADLRRPLGAMIRAALLDARRPTRTAGTRSTQALERKESA